MKVKQLKGSLIIRRFGHEKEDFKLYVMCDGGPVQVTEDRGDMVLETHSI